MPQHSIGASNESYIYKYDILYSDSKNRDTMWLGPTKNLSLTEFYTNRYFRTLTFCVCISVLLPSHFYKSCQTRFFCEISCSQIYLNDKYQTETDLETLYCKSLSTKILKYRNKALRYLTFINRIRIKIVDCSINITYCF